MTPWRSLSPSLRGTLVLVLVGVIVVAGSWWYDGRHRVDVGLVETTADVFSGSSRSASFQTPGGSVSVTVETGQRSSENSSDDSSEEVDRIVAPRGGSLAEISWVGRAEPRTSQLPEADPPAPSLSLKVAGQRYPIAQEVPLAEHQGGDTEDRDRVVIALPSTDRNLVVELVAAGRRQSVNVATGRRTLGAFAPLYRRDVGRLVGRPTGDQSDSTGLTWSSTVASVVEREPYLDGLGWAKPGREWLVLKDEGTRLRVSSIYRPQPEDSPPGAGGARYTVRPSEQARGSLTIANARLVRPPSTALDSDDGGAEYHPGEAVFEVGRGVRFDLSMKLTIPLQPRDDEPDAPPRPEPLVVTETLTYPAVSEPGAEQ